MNDSFIVSDFLALYNDVSNPLRFEKMFTPKNTKKLIDAWVGKFNSERHEFWFKRVDREKKWIKKY